VSYWRRPLWFRSLGYGEVFWRPRPRMGKSLQPLPLSHFSFSLEHSQRSNGAFRRPAQRPHHLYRGQCGDPAVATTLRLIAIGVSLLIAVATGAAMQAQWPLWRCSGIAPHSSGTVADPIFQMPLNFSSSPCPPGSSSPGGCFTLRNTSILAYCLSS